ncbi:hypothetical protein GOP47_0008412 [Adiantum capillus-veneris]|uniref:Uncharacterized protein n=1 Tax=Adiantum capillus-veneris TaxID=13818 RepID=A0A9D4UZQ8_ADICA|nr:hypothetical protein GOP47_0008412 [Adiantum capillus-veneris]
MASTSDPPAGEASSVAAATSVAPSADPPSSSSSKRRWSPCTWRYAIEEVQPELGSRPRNSSNNNPPYSSSSLRSAGANAEHAPPHTTKLSELRARHAQPRSQDMLSKKKRPRPPHPQQAYQPHQQKKPARRPREQEEDEDEDEEWDNEDDDGDDAGLGHHFEESQHFSGQPASTAGFLTWKMLPKILDKTLGVNPFGRILAGAKHTTANLWMVLNRRNGNVEPERMRVVKVGGILRIEVLIPNLIISYLRFKFGKAFKVCWEKLSPGFVVK